MLRAETPSADVVFDGDDLDTTIHLGARRRGDLVAISTWLRRPPPRAHAPNTTAYQLRGMASHPDVRGSGAGAALLEAGLDRCRTLGAASVWARARTTAIGFYEHHGFAATSGEYVDTTTGLPHRDITIDLR